MLEVIWEDCASIDEWTCAKRVIAKSRRGHLIRSCGYLLHECDERLILVHSLDDSQGNVGGSWIIPKSQIKEIYEIHCESSPAS